MDKESKNLSRFFFFHFIIAYIKYFFATYISISIVFYKFN